MRRHFVIAALVLGGLLATLTWAQPSSAPAAGSRAEGGHVVGVLDLIRVFNEANQIRDLNDLMKEQADNFAKEAEQRRRVIEDKQTLVRALRPGTPEYSEMRTELTRLNIDANVWLQTSEAQVDQDKFEWTKVIYEKTMRLSSEIARERGYDIVLLRQDFKPDEIEPKVATLRRYLQDRTVLYNSPEIDITDLVIQQLNEDYKAGGGKKQLGKLTPLTNP